MQALCSPLVSSFNNFIPRIEKRDGKASTNKAGQEADSKADVITMDEIRRVFEVVFRETTLVESMQPNLCIPAHPREKSEVKFSLEDRDVGP